jgi:two-component system, NarL family, sensor kinase
MKLRWAIILLAVLPLVAASIGMAVIVQQRAKVVGEMQAASVQPVLLAARKAELQNYVNLARSAIAYLVRDAVPDAKAQAQALDVLRRLEFGHDGYFFVYDFQGRNLLNPREPHLQGENQFELQDRSGEFTVQKLIAQARSGGGYVEYEWYRPSTGQIERKVGYVDPIAGWEWVLGTGTYVDEPAQARERIAETTAAAVNDTLVRLATIALLASAVVVVGAMAINVNEQRKADAKLRAMAREIVMSQEAERARVARELHDGVSQWLVSVKYVFESALERSRAQAQAAPDVTRTLEGGVERLREVLGEVRRISHDLRPALLDDLGLAKALEHLAQQWSQATGLRASVRCVAPEHLPEAVATAIFRVAQEALGNVERHAAAQSVSLTLAEDGEGALVMTLDDDGQGFDVRAVQQSPRRGLGLTHMRERVQSLGGRFNVTSSATGTRVGVWFPAEALQT